MFSTRSRVLALVLFALSVGTAAAASPAEDTRRPDAERTGPALPDRLPAPSLELGTALEAPVATAPEAESALAARLAVLGVPFEARTALLELAPAARDGNDEALARLHDALGLLDLAPREQAKARLVVETYLARQPLGTLGLELELADRLLQAELLRLGVEPETAGRLVLAGRQVGWPADVDERESLRLPFEAALAGQPELLEAALDAGALRNQAPVLLDPVAQDELLRPSLPKDHLPGDQETVVCRACPFWNFGLLYPGDEWETHESALLAGECKVYRFVLEAGETYRFSFCNGGGTADFDTVLQGTDGLCHVAAFNDDSCGTLSEIEYTSGVTGYFYLQVRDAAAAGGHYTLAYRRVASAGGDPEATCTECPDYDADLGYPTTSWQTVNDSILSGGCRTYRFNLLGGHTYRFTTCEPDSGGSAAFDTVLDSTNTSQACYDGPSNDDACGTGSTLEFTPRFAQYVTITVRGFDLAAWGSFSLAYRDVTGECVDCPDAYLPMISPDATRQTVAGHVPAGGGCDLIPVQVVDGYSYSFRVGDGLPGSFTTFDTEFELLDASCNPIPADFSYGGFSAAGRWRPCYTGLAYLRVSGDSGSDYGDYSLAYTEACGFTPGCGTGCNVQDGPYTPDRTLQTTSFFLPGDGCRVIAFELEAARTYRFRVGGGPTSLTPGQEVFLSMRRPGCTDCPGNAYADIGTPLPFFEFTPRATGTHYLIIRETDGTSGPVTMGYRLVDDCTNLDDGYNLDPYAFGQYADVLTTRFGARYVGFQGPPGRTYRFTICDEDSEGTPFGAFAPPRTALILMSGFSPTCDPDLPNAYTNVTCPGELDVTFPPSGLVVLKVARLCSFGGNFSLRWSDITPRIVFISSERVQGDFGGPLGAFLGCSSLAGDPGALAQVQAVPAQGGSFLGWVSDGLDGGPRDYYELAAGIGVYSPADLVLPDGTLLWNNILEIFDQGLPPAVPIMMTETGAAPMPGAAAWTATDPFGGLTGPTCDDWGDGTNLFQGRLGRGGMTDSTWTDAVDRDCDLMRHVYCFETPEVVP